jgi:hypothetical protein
MIKHEWAVIKSAASAAKNTLKHDQAAVAQPRQPDNNARINVIQEGAYSDVNCLKKRIWKLGTGSLEIYTINAFGLTKFEDQTRVYGSPNVFDEMEKALLIWNAEGSNVPDPFLWWQRIKRLFLECKETGSRAELKLAGLY